MAQNYNLNSSFGFNVTGGSNIQPQQKEVETNQKIPDVFGAVTNYVDKYESVFTGDVEKEINMYSRQMMIVGMNLRAADKTVRKFDMNI